jgi:hypothetical protein
MTLEVPLECNCTEMDKNHLEEAKVNSTLGERESSMSGRKETKTRKMRRSNKRSHMNHSLAIIIRTPGID